MLQWVPIAAPLEFPLSTFLSSQRTVQLELYITAKSSLSLSLTKSFSQYSSIITHKTKAQRRCFLSTSNGSQVMSSLTHIKEKAETQIQINQAIPKLSILSFHLSIFLSQLSISFFLSFFFFFKVSFYHFLSSLIQIVWN